MKIESLSAAERATLATQITRNVVDKVLNGRAMRELTSQDWTTIELAKLAAREALGVSLADYTEALFS